MRQHDQASFGWCGPIHNAQPCKEAGPDYIEVQIVPMKLEDDSAFAEAKMQVADLPLPALAMS